MIEKMEIYKCKPCDIMVEALTDGAGEMTCCDETMQKLLTKTADTGKEKHVPVIEKVKGGIKVKVGGVPHPMEEKHYIQWIEVLAQSKAYRHFLKPGDAPETVFNLKSEKVTAREYCNVHGLWKS